MIRNIFKKSRTLLASAVFLLAVAATAGTNLLGQTKTVSAASSCDKVNIVYCGINGGSDASDISNFKSRYTSNKSGHSASPTVKKDYTDIQAVYNWAGASKTIVAGMNTTNTKLGTMYKDGHITVDGVTVGTDAVVTARFTNGTGFTKIEGNVYSRKTTTSLAEASAPVMVYMQNGKMVFAVMVECGNAVKATPKTPPTPPPAPVPSLSCDQLAFTQSAADASTFSFTAKATAKNTTITSYVFNFGDSSSKTVTTSGNTVSTSHAYAKPGTYTATVAVNSKDKTNVTSAACAVKITIAQPANLVCNSLTDTQVGTTNQFNFAAKATPTNTTITSYVFDFGDKSAKATVTTGATSATTAHTYTSPGTYTALVSVNSKDKTNVTAAACAVTITIAPPAECKPGVPAGSPECNVTPVTTCDELVISPTSSDNKDQYSFVVKATATDATITGYSIDFGDKTTPYSGKAASVDHTYAAAGNYTAVATVTFMVNGQSVTKSSAACTGQVTITQPMCTVPGKETLPANSPDCVAVTCTSPTTGQTYPVGSTECTPPTTVVTTPPTTPTTPPTTLVNTGAGDVFGLFAGVSIAAAAAHRIFASRRASFMAR